ncbi:MAG: helix-turn-helix transcriptional regulator, partial [Thermodesulfobacteriota bacterium]
RLEQVLLSERSLEPSRIYATLADLERAGLVAPAAEQPAPRRKRRVYELTGAGRTALRDWLARRGACRAFLQRPLLVKAALAAYLGQPLDPKLLRAERSTRERLRRALGDERHATTVERLAGLRRRAHLEAELATLDDLAAAGRSSGRGS